MNKSSSKYLCWIAVVLLLQGCLSGGENNPNSGVAKSDADYRTELTAFGDNVSIPSYESFEALTQSWASNINNISAYCAAIDSASEQNALNSAQAAWRSAMATWQQIEAFQVGPITDNASNLRNRIYSWPNAISTCTIDQQVIIAENSAGYDISSQSNQARGLDTLEYLLFNSDLSHTCPAQIVETQNWNSRTELERKQARCDYAALVAEDINRNANGLLQTWSSDAGNYRQSFIESGSEGGAFDSQTAALNALSDSLFYIEADAKDLKLGIPLGLHVACGTTTCADDRESPYSENSLENIKHNLIGFRAMFTGSFDNTSTARGFDDLLYDRNFASISTEILQITDSIIADIDAHTKTLNNDLSLIIDSTSKTQCLNDAANPSELTQNFSCSLQGKLKQLTNILKGDFLTIVSLSLPNRVEGDND